MINPILFNQRCLVKRKKYTQEFKQQSVNLVTGQGYSVNEASASLNVPSGNIHRWLTEFSGKVPALVKTKPKPSVEQEELTRLRKENHRLKQEREILKKAAAFFAGESN